MVGIDPHDQNRILLFDSDPGKATLPLPTSFFASHRQIDVRTDMLDTGIDICSPDVLARFSDEFDYRDIRRQFVANSCAEEEEGLQNRIYAHLLGPSEYAARVHDPRTYAAVSSDLLRRWCYPVVPDNLPSGYEKRYRYVLQRRYVYREANHPARIGRSSKVVGPGMVGSRCRIGEGCIIKVSCPSPSATRRIFLGGMLACLYFTNCKKFLKYSFIHLSLLLLHTLCSEPSLVIIVQLIPT